MNPQSARATSWMDDEEALSAIASATFVATEGTAMAYAVQENAPHPGVLVRKLPRTVGGRDVLVWMPDALIERLRQHVNGPYSVGAVVLTDWALDRLLERGERLLATPKAV